MFLEMGGAALHKESIQEAIIHLKNSGVRITPQRHAIIEFLIESQSHPTADEIYKALEGKFPNMSVATVYNNLRALREVGMVKELTFGDSSSRFDYVTSEHYHIICEKCGKMTDFHYDGLNSIHALVEKETGYSVTNHRMEVYGVCPSCKETKLL
jgi:Fur family peroxide stress response transcriptional regulator